MPVVTDPMDFAARQFLRARDRFLSHSGSAVLDTYLEATQRLLMVFASDWTGTDDALVVAFHAFRQALIEQQEPAFCDLHQFFRL